MTASHSISQLFGIIQFFNMEDEKYLLRVNGGASALNANKTSSTPYLSVTKIYFLKPLYKNRDFLHQEYVLKGHSIRQIAESIASSRDAVASGLKEVGIEVRSPHQAHGNFSQPAFGTSVRNGKVVNNKSEMMVIEQIKALNISGQSLRQIAQTLTKMGLPTKNRGKAWHPNMVKRILDRCG